MAALHPLRFALAALTLVCLAACGGGGGGSKATPVPTPTEAAGGSTPATQTLATYVTTTLSKPFVEDCTKADPAADAGKVCATNKGDRDNMTAFQLSPVGGKPSQWIIVQNGAQPTVIQATNITDDNVNVPGVPWPIRTGVDLVVAGSDPCVNVREGPSLNNKAVDCIADGTKLRLIAGPVPSDNFQFWQVEGRTGWVVADFLRYPDAAQ